MKLSNTGTGVLSSLIAITIAAGGIYYFATAAVGISKREGKLKNATIANAYLLNALEHFRTYKPDQLRSVFSFNPVNDTLPPYHLCTWINIKDRGVEGVAGEGSGKIINSHPLGTLDPNSPLAAADANLSFKIEVSQNDNLANVDKTVCNQTIRDYNLPPDRFYIVTAAVNYRDTTGKLETQYATTVVTNDINNFCANTNSYQFDVDNNNILNNADATAITTARTNAGGDFSVNCLNADQAPFLDVNGDRRVTDEDRLLVVNEIASLGGPRALNCGKTNPLNPRDVNNDGAVNALDRTAIQTVLGSPVTPFKVICGSDTVYYDVNRDGIVDGADLALI